MVKGGALVYSIARGGYQLVRGGPVAINAADDAARAELQANQAALDAFSPDSRGPTTIGVDDAVGGAARSTGKVCSFHGDTLVLTDGGLTPIRDVTTSMSVWSRNPATGAMAMKPVEAQYSNPYEETISVSIRKAGNDNAKAGAVQTIVSNRIHPYFVQTTRRATNSEGHDYQGPIANGKWVDAGDLLAGDRLLNNDATWSQVVSVKAEDKPLTAYNLTVSDFHTYFVSGSNASNIDAASVWVHNNCLFPNLNRHYRDHGEALGVNNAGEYLAQATGNVAASGGKFRFRHNGSQKLAHITKIGLDEFMMTSTTLTGKKIFTHLVVTKQYLRNIGITLPNGF